MHSDGDKMLSVPTEQVSPFPVDDRVLPLDQVAEGAGISTITLRRLVKDGRGPTVTWMSARRCGVRIKHLRQWLDGRAVEPGGQAA